MKFYKYTIITRPFFGADRGIHFPTFLENIIEMEMRKVESAPCIIWITHV